MAEAEYKKDEAEYKVPVSSIETRSIVNIFLGYAETLQRV
jgi:hypothetical protein